MTKNPDLHPEIAAAVDLVESARANLRETTLRVRASCPHDRVLHVDWHRDSFGAVPGMRLCCRCGLEEHSQWGSVGTWTSTVHGRKPLLTTQFVKLTTSAEVVRSRIPHLPE
jgi:hypothetical protein